MYSVSASAACPIAPIMGREIEAEAFNDASCYTLGEQSMKRPTPLFNGLEVYLDKIRHLGRHWVLEVF